GKKCSDHPGCLSLDVPSNSYSSISRIPERKAVKASCSAKATLVIETVNTLISAPYCSGPNPASAHCMTHHTMPPNPPIPIMSAQPNTLTKVIGKRGPLTTGKTGKRPRTAAYRRATTAKDTHCMPINVQNDATKKE